MYKGLVVSRHFLMNDSPGGQIERILFSHVNPVFCSLKYYISDIGNHVSGHSFNVKIIREKKWMRYGAAVIRSILSDLTFLPGYEWWSWGVKTVKAIEQETIWENVDYVHSVSYPCASHWVVFQLIKKTGKPWVAHFLDPWVENPYRPFKTKYFKDKDYAMERKVAIYADLIIHNSQSMVDSWINRYGDLVRNKIVVLPMPISLPNNYLCVNKLRRTDKNKITISHIGSLTHGRTSEVFIKAVKAFVCKYPELSRQLEVKYVGTVCYKDKKLISEFGLQEFFSLVGQVSEQECVGHYVDSDAFLAIDSSGAFFYPSKILKYFYFERPILGIACLGSVLEVEMHESRNTFCVIDKIEDIEQFLFKLLSAYDTIAVNDRNYWRKYLPKQIARQYENLISSLLEKKHL